MKTRDRILDTSLTLFNEEGEAALSAVDIANALEMSPGNLYYHFKGKEPIIEALFGRFEDEMSIILNGSLDAVESVEDNWVFVYIVLEEIYDFRFFYRNVGELVGQYPSIAVRFRNVLAMKRRAIESVLSVLEKKHALSVDKRIRGALIDQLVSTLTFWLSFDVVEGTDRSGPRLIHDTVLRFMLQIVPYMGDEGQAVLERMLERHREMVQA